MPYFSPKIRSLNLLTNKLKFTPRPGREVVPRRPATEAELLSLESNIGRNIFGPIPDGTQREFFNHKNNIWIYHESCEESGRMTTIRYEVRTDGVYKKSFQSKQYVRIESGELDNFMVATREYLRLIKRDLYHA